MPTSDTAARCGHWRCRLYRFFSVMETAGVIFLTNRWPIPCQAPIEDPNDID